MHLTIDEITRLSLAERLNIIDQLWASLESANLPVTPSQQDELMRRLAAFGEDRAEGISWENLKAELAQRHI